jgi:hypothetical protein
MSPGARKQVDVSRLKADLAAATVELLSAHCATDRVRLKYSLHDIVTLGDRHSLQQAIASAEAIHGFLSQIQARIQRQEDENS